MKYITLILSIALLLGIQHSFAQNRISAPELDSPDDMETDIEPSAVLDWEPVSGSGIEILYEAQISESSDFTDAVTFEKTELTSITAEELKFGQRYYWRVRAEDETGFSDWSEAWSFTILNVTRITSPSDLNVIPPQPNPQQEGINWRAVSGVDYYVLQLDTLYFWQDETSPITSDILAVEVVSAQNVWFCGNGGMIWQKTDDIYSEISSGTEEDLTGISFTDAGNGWIVGASGTILYFNGNDFAEQSSGTTEDLHDVLMISTTEGYAVGDNGTLLAFDGSDWTTVDVAADFNIQAIDGSEGLVFAVGDDGNYLQLENGSWTASETGFGRDLNAVTIVEDEVWVCGQTGRIHQLKSGVWKDVPSGVTRTLTSAGHYSVDEIWFAGERGTLVSCFQGVCTPQTSGSSDDFFAASLMADGDSYVAGEAGLLIKSQDGAFENPVITVNIDGSETNYAIANLFFGTNYYPRIKMVHGSDESSWSGALKYTVISSPTPSKPDNESSGAMLDQLLTWNTISGVFSYGIQISSNAEFINPFFSESETNSISARNLTFGQQYYWRVNARHPADVSDWSEAFSFTTVNEVSRISPEDMAEDVNRSVNFVWEPLSSISGYLIEVSLSDDFSNAIIIKAEADDENITSPQPLAYNETYYWRIRGLNNLDSTNWSSPWSFTVESGVGIEEMSADNALLIFPNPNKGSFFVNYQSSYNSVIDIQILDLTGKVIRDQSHIVSSGQNTIEFNLPQAQSGLYLVRIRTEDAVMTRKLFVD